MAWDPSGWEKCKGLNAGGECKKTKGVRRHIAHKKHWLGGWYGQFSHKHPDDPGYGKNKPRPPKEPKKDSKGIFRW